MHGKRFLLTKDYGELHPDRPKWKPYTKGATVKAVMVSRMGDVGVTLNLEAQNGYDLRVMPWELDPVEPRPDNVCRLCNLEQAAGGHDGGHLGRKCEKCGGETGPCDPLCFPCSFKDAMSR